MKITVNFEKELGCIRPLNSVGQPPRYGVSDKYMHYLTDAHIPFSRLHDVGGPFGASLYVDIPNIFRDFSANEYDPASYDFSFTDLLIKQVIDAKCEPIYRLGVTIENYQHIKTYRLFPPSDFSKWARICEHIIRHYNEGWANGFSYGIKYWEIWNEPENSYEIERNEMWHGTREDYFRLYETASKYLKKCFGDSIKLGGYGACGFYAAVDPSKNGEWEKNLIDFFQKFLDFIDETGSPIDFFSWHSYTDVERTLKMADYLDAELTKHGLGHIETQLNEWNNAGVLELRGSSYASAHAAKMMIEMHNKKTDIMCYYDARIGPSAYGGLFNPLDHKPLSTYYSMKAFGELYALGTRVEALSDSPEVSVLAAANGDARAVMLANTGKAVRVETELSGMKVILIDKEHHFTMTELDSSSFELAENQVALICNGQPVNS